ncbi:class I histocompatibility antigen, F10 alpha chain-like [Colius striatus]|uniref:class I histocompatibility antigen, F10 alpha chain-like n=1 Tax=Colius striatus TaxID=57412 RepID=UPI002B1E5F18|nr:class I histocompatibility antigen, F10 alpha chain-like [Colius striatus]
MGPVRALGMGLLLGVVCGAASGLHSLRCFGVALSEPSPGLPQYVEAWDMDGTLISSYDSDRGRAVPRVGWMAANMTPEDWDSWTQVAKYNHKIAHGHLDVAQILYNQRGGAHTWQHMYGCDLLEDGSTRGYWQHAYDGRDFIAFHTDTMTFSAAEAAAQRVKSKLEEGNLPEQLKRYLEGTCMEWLRRYVSYGREMLERKASTI